MTLAVSLEGSGPSMAFLRRASPVVFSPPQQITTSSTAGSLFLSSSDDQAGWLSPHTKVPMWRSCCCCCIESPQHSHWLCLCLVVYLSLLKRPPKVNNNTRKFTHKTIPADPSMLPATGRWCLSLLKISIPRCLQPSSQQAIGSQRERERELMAPRRTEQNCRWRTAEDIMTKEFRFLASTSVAGSSSSPSTHQGISTTTTSTGSTFSILISGGDQRGLVDP